MSDVVINVRAIDQATAVLANVKSGLEGVARASKSVVGHLAEIGKQTVATALGLKLGDMLSGASSLWSDMIESTKTQNKELREMGNILLMTGKSDRGWPELMKQAELYRSKLQNVAIGAGVAKEELVTAFDAISLRSQKPPENVMKMVENMALASRIVPSGVKGMIEGFKAVENGVIRPNNEIVLLIRQAGLMKGSARDISQNLMAMGDEGKLSKATPEVQKLAAEMRAMGRDPVMALTERAIATMAERAKGVPLTMSQVITSLKESKSQILETAGTPILKGLMGGLRPPFEDMRKYLISHRMEIEHWAKTAGEKLGVYVALAAEKLRQGFQYLQTHGDEIMSALSTGASALMTTMKFIVANKEIILALALMGGTRPGRFMVDLMAGTVAAGARGAGGTVTSAIAATGLGSTGAAVAGAAVGLAAFAAAIAAVGAAAYNAGAYLSESKGHITPWAALASDDAQAIMDSMSQMVAGTRSTLQAWTAEEVALYNQRKSAALAALEESEKWSVRGILKRMSDSAGVAPGLSKYFGLDKRSKEVEAAKQKMESDQKSVMELQEKLSSMESAAKRLQAQKAATAFEAGFVGPVPITAEQEAVASSVKDMYNIAFATHNDAAMAYVAKFVAGNTGVATALIAAGALSGEGFDAFISVLQTKAPALAAALQSAGTEATWERGIKAAPEKKRAGGGGGGGAAKPTVSFRIETYKGQQLAIIGASGIATPITSRSQTFSFPVAT